MGLVSAKAGMSLLTEEDSKDTTVVTSAASMSTSVTDGSQNLND